MSLNKLQVAVAENICTSDMPTTCSSKMLEGFKSPYDATVIKRLKDQGAVITGKIEIDEFNIGTGEKMTESIISSGAYFIVGSDTDGSLRLPAANCGMVGYKPTYGAVSRHGLISYAGSFDQIGAITRTVSDAALLISAIAGFDEFDATSNPNFKLDLSGIREFNAGNIKGKKIGIPREYARDIEPLNAVVETYKSMGAEFVDISMPLTEYALPVYYIISSAEASSNLAKFDGLRYGYRTKNFSDVDSLYINSRTEGFGEEVKKRIIMGTYVLSSEHYAEYYKKARIAMFMMKEEFKAAFEKCDIILTPVCDNRHTVPANIAGLPAISVPCGKNQNNKYVSFQLIGKRFDDANLLGFARMFESESGEIK